MRRERSGVCCVLAACALCWGVVTAAARPVVADPSTDDRPVGALAGYIARNDSSYRLREVSTGHIGATEYVELILTSQTWRGIPWKHQLFALRPSRMRSESRQVLLFIHGGGWSARSSSRDFRSVRWVSRSCARSSGGYVCHASLADAGYTATFAVLSFKDRREPAFSLSTTVCIARPSSEADRLDC